MVDGLNQQLARLGTLADLRIREALEKHVSPQAPRLAAILEYHLGWRDTDLQPLETPAPAGKKLRPAMTLLVAEAVGGDITPAALDAAAAIELIHNFSLIHDDIQDHSELRRHRRTIWSVWGMPQGINIGDAMFALAQLVVLGPGPTATGAAMAATLNAAALMLSEGQFLDIDLQEGRLPASLEAYESMITRKTGVLFGCAARLGAIAAQASPEVGDAFAAYGLELGIAFQEQDDVLGVWGASTETGKPDAADIVERKRGLPAALALSAPDAPEWLTAAYARSDGTADPAIVERIVAHFGQLNLRDVVEQRVNRRYTAARAWLDKAGGREPAHTYLAAICEALVARRT